MSERTFVCDICGHERPWDEHTEFDGQDLCAACLDTNTILCHECRERLWTDENAGSRDIPLCQDCYDEYYTHCCQGADNLPLLPAGEAVAVVNESKQAAHQSSTPASTGSFT